MAFDLASIASTKSASPPRILIYGPQGVGKNMFFSGGDINLNGKTITHKGAPRPIFIRTEDGMNGLDGQAFPLCKSYPDVLSCLDSLIKEKHDFKTVIIDSLDWLEALMHNKIVTMEGEKAKTIGTAQGGYGKGHELALTYWHKVLGKLDILNKEKRMIIGMVCHAVVLTFDDPEGEPYDHWEIKLHENSKGRGAKPLLYEAVDVVGFANRDFYVTQKETAKGDKKAKGVDTGELNKLHLVGAPAFKAKNRYNLPAVIDLNWSKFSAAMGKKSKPIKKEK